MTALSRVLPAGLALITSLGYTTSAFGMEIDSSVMSLCRASNLRSEQAIFPITMDVDVTWSIGPESGQVYFLHQRGPTTDCGLSVLSIEPDSLQNHDGLAAFVQLIEKQPPRVPLRGARLIVQPVYKLRSLPSGGFGYRVSSFRLVGVVRSGVPEKRRQR